MALLFEWHEEKAAANLKKHGVSFEEAKTVFNDPLALTIEDPKHSRDEQRFIDIGYSESGGLLVVAYTERGEAIRIISSRKATQSERRAYENA